MDSGLEIALELPFLIENCPYGDSVVFHLRQSLVGKLGEVFVSFLVSKETAVFQRPLNHILVDAFSAENAFPKAADRAEASVDRDDSYHHSEDDKTYQPCCGFNKHMNAEESAFARKRRADVFNRKTDDRANKQRAQNKDGHIERQRFGLNVSKCVYDT